MASRCEWFTAKTLAGLPGLPGTESAVIRRAKRENWQARKRAGRGGGMEYHISSLPQETRKALAANSPSAGHDAAGFEEGQKLALAAKVKRQAERKSAEAGLKTALTLPEREKQRDAARSAILADWQAYRQLSGEAGNPSLASYALLYNAGQREEMEAARQTVPKVSASTMMKWRRQLKQQGHLGARYGNRKAAGKIDSQPEIKDFVKAMMVSAPHCKASQVIQGLRARFAGRADIDLPSQGRLNAWMVRWKKANAQEFSAVTSPDHFKSNFMAAFGSMSEGIERLNQLWEFDGTPADIMFTDGRHSICGVIDVYARRPKMLVTPTAKATAVAALLRRALLDWGVCEIAKTDNGSDYKGYHMTRVFSLLEIEQILCPPFSPWHKPHIERFFRTFSHDLVELLPGFVGHNVAERKAIEDRKAFSDRLFKKDAVIEVNMTAAEFQALCDEWCENIYMHRKHDGLGGKTPFQMVSEWRQPLQRIGDERALDLLLAEAPGNNGIRTVTKKGIRLDHGLFIAPKLWAYIGKEVRVLYAPTDLGRVQVFGGDDFVEFVCVAECPERTGIDRAEVAAKARALQKEAIQQARRELKKAAKKVGVDDIVGEIRRQAALDAGKLASLPKPSEEYTSAGLEAAGKAAEALAEPVAAMPERDQTEFLRERLKEIEAEQAQQAATIQPEERKLESYERWKKLEARVQAGEQLAGEDERFFKGYCQTAAFRARQVMEEDFGAFYARG